MNPDNLATPLAASIGDVVSLSVLSFIASLLFENLGKFQIQRPTRFRDVIDIKFIFEICSHTLLGHICRRWTLLCVVAILGDNCSLQQIYAKGIEIWMGASAISVIYQRVSEH